MYILGLFVDNGKWNGNYYILGLGFRVLGFLFANGGLEK